MTADDPTTRLLEALEGLDLTSADGRAGIRALLSEIERLAPGAILRQAASIELDRVGWRRPSAGPRPAAPSASMGLPSRPSGPTVGAAHPEGEIA